MKFLMIRAALGPALLVLLSVPTAAAAVALARRQAPCQFPTNDNNLVPITPNRINAGWAMSPDQPCLPGQWCPFACRPGMLMAQWDPNSRPGSPSSVNGGLFCNANGQLERPFPNQPNCVQGTGSVEAVNESGRQMSWCQTVLPGNEEMLVPTIVSSVATIAVPGPSYWNGVAAQYFINPPGIGTEGCAWGTASSPTGNWAPYIASTNTDANGLTFVSISVNPTWEASELGNSHPGYTLEVQCPDGGCNGLPCQVEPGNVRSCVVSVASGNMARIVASNVA